MYKEAETGGIVQPGMLVERTITGTIIAHAEEGGRAEAAFALEDALQGKAVGDNYASGVLAAYILPNKGSCVNALLQDGQDVAIDEELVSAGDGTLKARGSSGSGVTEWQTIARACQAFDNASSSSGNALMEVRIV